MDLVKLLEDAVQALPPGDYSVGLNAIVRHVKAAIRHLDRDQQHDPDTCTDAIYRMNQAYEGSLKEAYRVLAAKDPSGLTPSQIEGYLENNNIVRPRVLTQLTRYRQDYRNPSTHDYKLDFDQDEALLAIVSVCGFAKLLINQINSKLAAEAAQARAVPNAGKKSRASLRSQGDKIARIVLAYTKESSEVEWFEYERGIAESLVTAGFSANMEDMSSEDYFWDVVVRKGKSFFGIDSRMSRKAKKTGDLYDGGTFDMASVSDGCVGSLAIIRTTGATEYDLYKGNFGSKPAYFVVEDDNEQINHLLDGYGDFKKIS